MTRAPPSMSMPRLMRLSKKLVNHFGRSGTTDGSSVHTHATSRAIRPRVRQRRLRSMETSERNGAAQATPAHRRGEPRTLSQRHAEKRGNGSFHAALAPVSEALGAGAVHR